MKELENKIREALPRLKEIGVGLKFIDRLDFKAEVVYENVGTYYFFSESDNEVFSVSSNFFDGICKEVIGHPIKLNDVLEWLCLKNLNTKNYELSFDISGTFLDINKYSDGDIKDYEDYQWDLSSVFLADQSEELKEFLNSL